MIAETRKRGILHAVNPLARTTAATTVRFDNGKILATDGPFAETREQLAGYYVLDCKDLDEAIAWAAKIPTKCGGYQGSVEIRPIQQIPGVPESHLGSEPLDPARAGTPPGGLTPEGSTPGPSTNAQGGARKGESVA
jgi:hypothetical protein